jgi:hypothetical protein
MTGDDCYQDNLKIIAYIRKTMTGLCIEPIYEGYMIYQFQKYVNIALAG